MSLTAVYFENYSFFKGKVADKDISYLKTEINNIKNNSNNIVANNYSLAGNIEREYYFAEDVIPNIENIILPYARSYFINNKDIMEISRDTGDFNKLKITACWVNFQKKHEFNPIHDHKGVLSFVIWVQIPYSLEEEMKNSSVMYSNSPSAGCFQFLYNDILGNFCGRTIPCDKKDEGTLLMFPSRLQHCVYPFYTSDEYRITISGNIEYV